MWEAEGTGASQPRHRFCLDILSALKNPFSSLNAQNALPLVPRRPQCQMPPPGGSLRRLLRLQGARLLRGAALASRAARRLPQNPSIAHRRGKALLLLLFQNTKFNNTLPAQHPAINNPTSLLASSCVLCALRTGFTKLV